MGSLVYVSIRVFDSDSIWCSCVIVKWEGEMNHASLNTSALFGILMCCGSSIYCLTVTRVSTVIPWAEIRLRDWTPVRSLRSSNFWYLGSIWCVFLVVWASTGGVSEGVSWLAHGRDWEIDEFTLLLKWVSTSLPTCHFLVVVWVCS